MFSRKKYIFAITSDDYVILKIYCSLLRMQTSFLHGKVTFERFSSKLKNILVVKKVRIIFYNM